MGILHPKTPSRNMSDEERIISTVAGGALAVFGLTRKSAAGIAAAVAGGGYLIYRGVTGLCHIYKALGVNTADDERSPLAVVAHNQGIKVEKSVTINMPAEELYSFWHDFENLPRFMNHLESVHRRDDRISHWIAKGPAGTRVEWDAEVYNDVPYELIAWRSLDGSDVNHAGSVHFTPAPNGTGTEVRVVLNYLPPAGRVGAAVAKLFGEDPENQIAEDLRRLKQILETNEIATTEGQTSGRLKSDVPV